MKRRILFVDDHEGFREMRSEVLEQHGYEVIQTSTIAEATGILARQWVHLLIVDVRLQPDRENDRSGIEFAKQTAYAAIPKIILTAYPYWEDAVDVMQVDEAGNQAALQYLSKTEDKQKMLAAVADIFDNHLDIDWALTIEWTVDSLEIVGKLHPASQRHETTPISEYEMEIEDLLRRLYWQRNSIVVERILSTQRGVLTLVVYTQSEHGDMVGQIVQLGDKKLLARRLSEKARRLSAETWRYRANIYEMGKASVDALSTLKQLLAVTTVDSAAIILTGLFSSALQPIYAARWQTNRFKLIETVPNADSLQQKIVQIVQQAQKLQVRFFEVTTDSLHDKSHAVTWEQLKNLLQQLPQTASQSVYNGQISGGLVTDNILVDHAQQIVVLGYVPTGQSAPLIDAATLEADLSLHCWPLGELDQRLGFASQLALSATTQQQTPVHGRTKVLLTAVDIIRQHTLRLANCSLDVYQRALFWQYVTYLARFDETQLLVPSRLAPFLHALAYVLHFAQRQLYPIVFDDEKSGVQLESSEWIYFGDAEYALMKLFAKRLNQICTYDELVSGLSNYCNNAGAVRVVVGRLRTKLAENKELSISIENVRRIGYRFNFQPTPQ